jgi:flagellar basal-body rod protein FlgB
MTSVNDPDDLLLRLMSASTLRAKVLSENVANQNVPGYKRRVVRFEELLADKLARAAATGKEGSLADIKPRIDTDKATPSSPDGNNVSLELENNAMRENWLLYETYAAIMQSRNEMMRASISEGR